MSSVSTAFKMHYDQKLGTHSAILGGRTMTSGGIDAPGDILQLNTIMQHFVKLDSPVHTVLTQDNCSAEYYT